MHAVHVKAEENTGNPFALKKVLESTKDGGVEAI